MRMLKVMIILKEKRKQNIRVFVKGNFYGHENALIWLKIGFLEG